MNAAWLSLAESPAFRALFEADNSPLRSEIDRLENRIHSLAILDPVERMKDVASLYGIRRVQEVVQQAAALAAEEAARPQPVTERRRSSLANQALPRHVAG